MHGKKLSLVYNCNAHGSMASMPHLQYYPYGDTSYRAGRSISEVSQKRYRYTGKEKDEESGLYYHGARYYACWLGRWTAADPAGLVDGVNLYMYCRGNLVILLDDGGTQAKNENEEPLNFSIRELLFDKKEKSFVERDKVLVTSNVPNKLIEIKTQSERIKNIDIICEAYLGSQRQENLPPAKFMPDLSFYTMDEAGVFAINYINRQSIGKDKEFGGLIYEIDGKFQITQPKEGCRSRTGYLPKIEDSEDRFRLVGIYHTHGKSLNPVNQTFSSGEENTDIETMEEAKIVGYLGTEGNGNIVLKYTPRELRFSTDTSDGIEKLFPSQIFGWELKWK